MTDRYTDANGQPEPAFHLANNEIKAVNTLYGIIMGMAADRVVTDSEIYFLDLWLKENNAYTKTYPLKPLKKRVADILSDGIVTQEERDDLYQILLQMQGNNFFQTGAAGGFSNAEILEEPAYLHIKDALFCLTGQFISGPRDRCENALARFGGIPSKNVTRDLSYLIIGTLISRDWIASGHGRKIEKALYYKQKGRPITILSEESLLNFITIA
jgi:NAD-dependent DNA ligase